MFFRSDEIYKRRIFHAGTDSSSASVFVSSTLTYSGSVDGSFASCQYSPALICGLYYLGIVLYSPRAVSSLSNVSGTDGIQANRAPQNAPKPICGRA